MKDREGYDITFTYRNFWWWISLGILIFLFFFVILIMGWIYLFFVILILKCVGHYLRNKKGGKG